MESVEFLETSFKNDQASKHNRIVAAWALVKVGKQEYLDYLIKMLDDSDITTPTSHSPGVSLRAAQALSDINNWDFAWNKNYVNITKDRLKNVT